MRSVAIVNQKGGVGKTTTTANLAHALALTGQNVSVLDFDPQGHLSAYLGFTAPDQPGLGDILLPGEVEAGCLIQAREGLQLLPAGKRLKQVELAAYNEVFERHLKDAIRVLLEDQHVMLIDCPPASGTLIRYALSLADEILVPVSGDYLSLRGLSDLIGALGGLADEQHKTFAQWMVITRFHRRRKLCWEVRDKLLEYFPKQVLATFIRETSVLAESPGFGKTAFEYKKGNHGAEDYRSLADDFLQKRCMT